jgi:anaerobic carbon-monoxide dehydrogenase iron sulfur subunit
MVKKKFIKDNCVTCKRCVLECAVRHSASGNLYDAANETPKPRGRLHVLIRKDKPYMAVCQNCAKPKCIEACQYGAITKYEDGEVVIDTSKCVGDNCWACVEACPVGSVSKNTELNVAFNCDDCKGFATMACVEACRTRALVYTEKR